MEDKAYYFNQGWDTRERSLKKESNPYQGGSIQAFWFWQGWNECDRQMIEGSKPLVSRAEVDARETILQIQQLDT